MDRGAWWATAHGVLELHMTEQPALTHVVKRMAERYERCQFLTDYI